MKHKLRTITSASEDPGKALALLAATGAHEMMLTEIKKLEGQLAEKDQRIFELESQLDAYRLARDA